MTVVPADTPVTEPEEEPTDAMPVFALDHVPPETLLAKVADAPWHAEAVPVILAGTG
jgi:hypothetical protein